LTRCLRLVNYLLAISIFFRLKEAFGTLPLRWLQEVIEEMFFKGALKGFIVWQAPFEQSL